MGASTCTSLCCPVCPRCRTAATAGGKSKKRSRSKRARRLVSHTPEFTVLLELLLVAYPRLWQHAGVTDEVAVTDDGSAVAAVAARSVAALIAVADSMRVYVVNDDVAPHPQFRCLATLLAAVVGELEDRSRWSKGDGGAALQLLDGTVGVLRRLLQLNHALLESRLGQVRSSRSLACVVPSCLAHSPSLRLCARADVGRCLHRDCADVAVM